jgi:uncharacterized protein (DUF302 family)
MADKAGLHSARSQYDANETARRLRAAAEGAGLTIFVEVDHAQNAREVGMSLRPTLLLIFGNARGGTPLMQLRQTTGIDLPLKALVWDDEHGATWLTYNDAQWIADRHGLGAGAEQSVAAISGGMAKLVAMATA